VRELNGQVAGEQNDATSFIKPLGERDETLGIETVFSPCRFFKSCSSESRTCDGIFPSLLRDCMVSRDCGVGQGKLVQMTLKLA